MHSAGPDIATVFLELGGSIVLLALAARLASRWGFSAIPLYLLAGLAFGNGGAMPLNLTQNFIHIGAEIGVLLLLFMLGLEYTGQELRQNLRSGFLAGVVDFALNFPPGLIAGWLFGWKPLAAVLLGGVTYISSSGVIAKVLGELKRMEFPETPSVLSVLVLEDMAMAIYLPVVAALLLQMPPFATLESVGVALATVSFVFLVATRFGPHLSRWVISESDEVILLTAFGVLLVVAGLAQKLQVSAAIGAFLVGIAVSGPLAQRSHRIFAPLRDLFSAVFFFFFGLQIDPKSLTPVLLAAVLLGIATAATKIATGYFAAKRTGADSRARFRAGAALVARGEFSIVIAGLGVALEPQLPAFAAAYVLFLVILGPVLARLAR